MASLSPLPGFDWAKVRWAAPDAPRPSTCCYCDDPLPDDEDLGETQLVPLIVWTKAGACAVFCADCMVRQWGFEAP